MNVFAVYGTRPELIKMAPLIIELKKNKDLNLFVVNTGQHREMLTPLEEIFKIKADISLGVMSSGQTVSTVVSKVIQAMEAEFRKQKADLVFVQGDTATVLATAMAAYLSRVKIAHVEAGLRSFNLNHPFPEEFNRKTVSIIADYNFVPTQVSAQNLLNEGVPNNKIFVVGNTVIDALKLIQPFLKKSLEAKKTILVTAHRRENHGEGIKNICEAVLNLLQLDSEIHFVWPVHPNPEVKEYVYKTLGNQDRVQLCEPMDYIELLSSINSSTLIWTDSGGIQEECPSFRKPLLILRDVTERPEVISAGFGVLVGTTAKEIVKQTKLILNDPEKYKQMISGKNPFGDGTTSKKILEVIFNAKHA